MPHTDRLVAELQPPTDVPRTTFPMDCGAWRAWLARDGGSNYYPYYMTNGEDVRYVCDSVGAHGFLTALHVAYTTRRPFCLVPQQLWLLILQAITAATESPGGEEGASPRPGPPPGPPSSAEWVAVAARVGKDGSATSAECVAIGAHHMFADARHLVPGGISTLRMEGTSAEWWRLRVRAEVVVAGQPPALRKPWLAALLPVLKKLERAYQSTTLRCEPDEAAFWQAFYRADGDGWVHVFFPLDAEGRPNARCRPWQRVVAGSSPPPQRLPRGRWRCASEAVETGFFGAALDEDGRVRPEVGWVSAPDESSSNIT